MIQLLMHLFKRVRQDQIRKSLGVVVLFAAVFAYATTGFMYFERTAKPELTWNDSAWWAIVTMTTVGYGDFFPETAAGRMYVGFPVMVVGVSLLGYFLSLLATIIMEHKLKENRGAAQMQLSDHVIICHYNSSESILQLVTELRADVMTSTTPVVLIDEYLDELPDELRKENIFFVRGNPARESTLEQADFRNCKYFLLQVDERNLENSDTRNLTVALTIERLCPEIHSVVHCVDPENIVFFQRAHVDGVICPSALSRQLMVQELQDPGVHMVLSELTSNLDGKQFYMKKALPSFKTIGDVKGHFAAQNALLLGVRRNGQCHLLPGDDEPIQEGEELILIAAQRPGD